MAKNQALSKNFEFKNVNEFFGYNSTKDKTNIAPGYMVRGSQNVFKTLAGTLSVRPGQKIYSPADTTYAAVKSEYVWGTSWGATYPLIVANGKLQVLFNGAWVTLQTGVTLTRYVFDKFWDNTEKKDTLIFVRGDSNIYHWSGGITTVASVTTNTITKQGSTSWQQSGFSVTAGQKILTIGATTYTYTGGESTGTLTGVTPDPTGTVAGTVAVQAVLSATNTPAAGFSNDFVKIINNQAYYGSYLSRLCYISSNTDYINFTVPTPRLAGSPELLTLDGALRGIGVRQGKAHIGYGSGSWAVVSFQDIAVGTTLIQKTTVDVKPIARLQAPLGHEFITNAGDTLIYLAQDNQLRAFADSNLSYTPTYPSLSLDIATELSQINFTGGQVVSIGEFIYITSPATGKVFPYQVRQAFNQDGVTIGERIWHSPFIWNVSRIDDINGIVVGFSNANPVIYQLWDTNQWYDDLPSGEQASYSCVCAMAYRDGGRKQGLISFDKHFSEGYITSDTELNADILFNYNGALSTATVPINTTNRPAYRFVSVIDSLGDNLIGQTSLGDDIGQGEDGTYTKFKVISSLPINNCFEFQVVYYSDTVNARWEILSFGTNMNLEAEQQATFIVNKLRQ